jgi:hypothetical protein
MFIMDEHHVTSFLILGKRVNFTNMFRQVLIMIRYVDCNYVRQVCVV